MRQCRSMVWLDHRAGSELAEPGPIFQSEVVAMTDSSLRNLDQKKQTLTHLREVLAEKLENRQHHHHHHHRRRHRSSGGSSTAGSSRHRLNHSDESLTAIEQYYQQRSGTRDMNIQNLNLFNLPPPLKLYLFGSIHNFPYFPQSLTFFIHFSEKGSTWVVLFEFWPFLFAQRFSIESKSCRELLGRLGIEPTTL